MKKSMRKWIILGLAVIIAAAGAVVLLRKDLDVVGKESVTSFGKVLSAAVDQVTADDMNGGWSLSAPDGSARFIWSSDYSKSPLHDVMLEVDAQPFIDAGLDAGKLPESFTVYDGKLMTGSKLGQNSLTYQGEATPLASYEHIVGQYRSVIGYHAALDHYNVSLGGGNLFEWAKDIASNDKDIVFVLDPAPFIAAGVDPGNVAGWVFAKVTVDVGGKMTEVDKLLKPFDLM